jgi:hypothetical protein
MLGFKTKTLLATIGAVILPLLALAYLASLPGKGSTARVILQVAIIVIAVILFGLLLAKLLEQMNAARVGRWLKSAEGQEWLESLPEEERQVFQSRFDNLQ